MVSHVARVGWVVAGALALALVCGPTASAVELNDLVGDWFISVDMFGQKQPSDLKVESTEGGLKGTLKSPLGEFVAEGVRLEGDKHVLDYQMDLGGEKMPVHIEVKVVGDTFSGEVKVGPADQPTMNLQVKAARLGTAEEKALRDEIAAAQAAAGAPAAAGLASAADIRDFVGEWILQIDSPQGGQMNVAFNVKDVAGKAAADLLMPPPIGPKTIEEIKKTDKGIELKYALTFGEAEFEILMTVEKDGANIRGKMSDQSGLVSMDFTGLPKAVAEETGIEVTEIPAEAEGRGRRGGGGGRAGMRGATRAELKLGDKSLQISYVKVRAEGKEFEQLTTLADGEVVQFISNTPPKVSAEGNFKIGDASVRQGNVAENYKGVYSLWLKRAGQGWNLVFNDKADVWGTMHDPSADSGETALIHTTLSEPVSELTIELKPEGDGGLFRLAWGTNEWTAKVSRAD